MMNSALMQKKSRHNDTNRHLTGFARRAFMLLTLLVVGLNRVSGQVTIVGSGVLDESHVGEYATMKSSYPVDASSLVPGITRSEWSGTMASETVNHWSGNNVAYANYYGSIPNSGVYNETTLNLAKGEYVILAAGRGSSSGDVTIFMSVAGNEVTMDSRGSVGKGVNTAGEASFSGDNFANGGNGHGWQYFYVKFSVTADASVSVRVGGRTQSTENKWVSISTPILWKTIDNNVNQLITHSTAETTGGGSADNEKATVLDEYDINGTAMQNFVLGDARYIRFRLFDNETNEAVAIPRLTAEGITFRNYGLLGMAAVGDAAFLNGRNITILLPSNKDKYRLVSYLSKDNMTLVNDNGNYSYQEPEIKGKYSFVISHIFPGSLRSGDLKTIEIPLPVGTKVHPLTELGDDFNAISTGLTAKGTPLGNVSYNNGTAYTALNQPTQQVYGDGNVGVNLYSDLSDYDKLVVTVTYGTPRFLFNRIEPNGNCSDNEEESKMIEYPRGESSWVNRYFTREGNVFTVDLRKMVADKGHAYLHAIKGAYWQDVSVESMQLIGHKEPLNTIPMYYPDWHVSAGSSYNERAWVVNESTGLPYGDGFVNACADLSDCTKLVVTVTEGTPRFLFNRDVAEGQWNEDESQSHLIDNTKGGWSGKYFTQDGNTYIVDLEKMVQEKGYAHLHAIKGYSGNVTVSSMEVYKNITPSPNVYARLFVANKHTGELAEQSALDVTPSGSGWTQKTVDGVKYGQVYYGSLSNLKAALSSITVSSSQPLYLGTNALSLVVSSNLTRMIPNPASSADDINVEPNWEKQYLISFYKNDTYTNVLKEGGTVVRKAIPLNSETDNACALTGIVADYNDIMNSLPSSSSDKVYARIFVSDDKGNTLDNQNYLNYYGRSWVKKDDYGWIFYGDRSSFTSDFLQGFLFNSSPANIPSTGALVGLAVSSDMSQLLPASPGSVGDIEKEPAWDALYLYHFTYPFEGTLETGYFSHSKEVLLATDEVRTVQIPLNESLSKIKSEYVRANVTDANNQGLADNLHIRWFVTYNGEVIDNSENYLDPLVLNGGHKSKPGYGLYWNSKTGTTNPLTSSSAFNSEEAINWLNLNFTKPAEGHWHDYKVVVWLSDDTSAANGQTESGDILIHEPNINMVYYYSFFVEEHFRFVHSKGAAVEAYPNLPYLIKSSNVQQYDWDNSTSTVVPATSDTRQDVHTVIYDIYMNTSNGPQPLKLPFEAYYGAGNDLEPNAYIRWYDWETDLGSNKLAIGAPETTWLEELTDYNTNNSRGLFALNRDLNWQKPTHSMVGVTYDPTGLTGTHVIACDVSRYYDGIYRGSSPDTRPGFEGLNHPYLLHEPTLSMRYLFRIHPSTEIAEALETGTTTFRAKVQDLEAGTAYKTVKEQMFSSFYEENGLVVVSLNGSSGNFSLRANLSSLDNYFTDNGTVQCDHITWRAYLEDSQGLWRRDGAIFTNVTDRIKQFSLADVSGKYILLSGAETEPEKQVAAGPGMHFHILGWVGGSGEERAAVHYELEFIDAPALLVDNLSTLESDPTIGKDVSHRRKAYLDRHYLFGGHVNFDEFFDGSTLQNQNENHTTKPLPWADAQYGFCYPQIDQYRLVTNSGLTPMHGDYILLKSAGGPYSKHMDASQPYQYFFYRDAWGAGQSEMYDFTRLYGDKTYGGFLYVDASDEARTIAALEFDAKLCSGSEIFFTAAISDITTGEGGSIDPQLMIHVYGLDANNNKTEKPIVSFLSGSLRSVAYGTFQYCKWYQLYGHATVPSNFNLSQYTRFAVDIDNYSLHTSGADFCVDEINFYTSTGKVTVNMSGGTCADENMKFSANMDVEHLETKMILTGTSSNPQHIYYRIYEKTSEDASGVIQYRKYSDNSIYNNSGKSYGDVTICKYELNNDGTLTNNSNNNGYELIDGALFFDLLNDQEFNLEQGKAYFLALTSDLNDPNPEDEETGWANPNEPCDVYSNFFTPRVKYVHFLTIDEAHDVVSQIINGVCGEPDKAHKKYIIQTNYPDDNERTGFKALPYGESRELANATGGPLTDEAGEERDKNGVLFDFFVGTEAELNGNYQIGETTYNTSLLEALQHYRNFERINPQYVSYSVELAQDYESGSAEKYAILQDAISKGKLLLAASGTFEYDLFETQTFLAIPVKRNYVFDEVPYILCNYIPFTFTVNGGFNVPELTLGFDDVDYTDAGTERVIRVGLEQLNKMKTQGYKLHVPVNMYKDKHKIKAKKLYFPSDSYLTLSASNDNTQTEGKKFAKIVPINQNETRPYVNKNNMYLSLDLSECNIDFHEGYQYEVATTFHDEDDENSLANACIGDLFILIKVVPEFVTWESQPVGDDGNTSATETGFHSANWYNDDNWKRSTRAELYKGQNGGTQNTATAGHPNGYDNNGEGSLSNLTAGSNPGFVPMKFTYVTMPSNNHAPSLINEPRVVGEGVGSRRQGGGFLKLGDGDDETWLKTDRSPRDPDGTPKDSRTSSLPTENIYYDMLVRYSYSSTDPFGEGCFGHRYLINDGTWADQGTEDLTAKVFDVEKFQGNICREIYFKPGAELLRQQRLTYEKAWVEMELDANKWYLRASPLQSTYAGDMFVPYSNGRQETEAFQPISFDKTKGYSRTKYPIYQRSWGMNNGKVYVKQNDIRATDYSANLKYSAVTENLVEWGHTFNDVQVPYHTSLTLDNNLAGFSIRAHKKNQTDKTLIRLPKADTSYEYYDWTDANSAPAAGNGVKSVSKPNFSYQVEDVTLFTVPSAYRLVTDEHQHDGDLEYSIGAMQQNGDYVLVGNPYMVSIDMNKFFAYTDTNDDNSWKQELEHTETDVDTDNDGTNDCVDLSYCYWTYEVSEENGVVSSELKTCPVTVRYNRAENKYVPLQLNNKIVRPMQGFFVKKGTATNIVFKRQMQIDGNFPPEEWSLNNGNNGARNFALTLTAKNGCGRSTASVALSDKSSSNYAGGEDVKTMFDSNFTDVPTVYTVSADGMALSIDTRKELTMVPFGVTCSSEEQVNVQFLMDNGHLYVFDALLGTTTPIGDGENFSVQPNDYGRYYLTTNEKIGSKVTDGVAEGIVVSVRQDGIVTVTSNSQIAQVRAININGVTAYGQTDCGTSTTFQLQPGTYVIDVESNAGKQKIKIIVK